MDIVTPGKLWVEVCCLVVGESGGGVKTDPVLL